MTSQDTFETRERREVDIPIGGSEAAANLVVPAGARGMVAAMGSRDEEAVLGRLARELQEAGFATLLLNSESVGDDGSRYRDWLLDAAGHQERGSLLFGVLAAGGAASGALLAAAEPSARIGAVVCVEGRFGEGGPPHELPVPTLLLDTDDRIAEDHDAALAGVAGEWEVRVVRSSRRSSEEVLEGQASAAIQWFGGHLSRRRST